MIQDSVRQLEENIQKAKQFIELEKAMERLIANRDFKQLIAEGYLHDEAIRLVHLRADPAMQTPERQASILTAIDAIGCLASYFRTVSHNANVALKAIEADEFSRDELMAEELAQ